MLNESCPLTPKEQEFAAEHHNLIFFFLNSKGLAEVDWYDVAAIAYLKAVRTWLQRPELRRWKFSTIAYDRMSRDVYDCRRTAARRAGIAPTFSIDAPTGCDRSYYDMIPASDCVMDQIEAKFLMESAYSQLTERERIAHDLHLQGYSLESIASRLSVSDTTAHKLVTKIRHQYIQAGA